MMIIGASSCVDQSPTIAVFDQILESTQVTNKLLAPIIVYRNGVPLDTLPARTTRKYTLGKKGVFRHTWRLVPPRDLNGNKAGIDSLGDIGVQYSINADYTIDNGSLNGRTIFTPTLFNGGSFSLRLTINDRASDQVQTNLIIAPNQSLQGAPYYYWNSNSNVRVDATNGQAYYIFTRNDTNEARRLTIDDTTSAYRGAGRTFPLVVF